MARNEPSTPLERVPLRLWLGPVASRHCGSRLPQLLGTTAEIYAVPRSVHPLDGPAILLLHTDDLFGPDRRALLELAEKASPGRPVILGESRNRETLLDVINSWRAFRLVPSAAPEDALLAAVHKAHEAYTVEMSVTLCAAMLEADCAQLESAVAELQATQARLLHSERLATVGRVVSSLLAQTRTRLGALEAFRSAKAKVPAHSRLGWHWESVIDATDSFAALLEDMLALSENRAAHAVLRPEPLDPLVEHCVRLFRHDPLARDRDWVVACGSGAVAALDRFRIYHVMFSLLRHSAQLAQAAAPIEVRTSKEQLFAVIEVVNSSGSVDTEQARRSLESFVTSEIQTGMGLRLSRASIEAQGGTLEHVSSPRKGTRFRIRLPLVA